MKYGEGPGESVVHGPRTSSLRHWREVNNRSRLTVYSGVTGGGEAGAEFRKLRRKEGKL